MNNTITVSALFIGQNGSAGFITNEKYNLILKSTKDYAVLIESKESKYLTNLSYRF